MSSEGVSSESGNLWNRYSGRRVVEARTTSSTGRTTLIVRDDGIVDLFAEQPCGFDAEFEVRDTDGRHRRLEISGERHVVEPDHRDVVRAPERVPPQRVVDAEREKVVACNDRRRQLRPPAISRSIARWPSSTEYAAVSTTLPSRPSAMQPATNASRRTCSSRMRPAPRGAPRGGARVLPDGQGKPARPAHRRRPRRDRERRRTRRFDHHGLHPELEGLGRGGMPCGLSRRSGRRPGAGSATGRRGAPSHRCRRC